jgi:hypothetical protein
VSVAAAAVVVVVVIAVVRSAVAKAEMVEEKAAQEQWVGVLGCKMKRGDTMRVGYKKLFAEKKQKSGERGGGRYRKGIRNDNLIKGIS